MARFGKRKGDYFIFYKEAYDWLQNKLKIKNKNPSWGSEPTRDKILTKNTLITMSDGSGKKIIDIKEGDIVLSTKKNLDFVPRKVTKTFTNIGRTVSVDSGNTFWGSEPEKDKIPTNVSSPISISSSVIFNSPEEIEEPKTFIPPKMIDITKKAKRKISLEDKL